MSEPTDNRDVPTIENDAPQLADTPSLSVDERVALETTVGTRLNELFGDDLIIHDAPPVEDNLDDTNTDTDTDTDNLQSTDDTVVTDDNDDDLEPAGEAAADEPIEGSDAPILPDSHRRSLQDAGWADDEIDTNLSRYGTQFLTMSSKIHADRQVEVARWAEAGRIAKEQRQPQQQPYTPPVEVPVQSTQVPTALQPVDVEALKSEYGEDTLIDRIAQPVNALISSVNSILPQLQQARQTAQDVEIERLSVQVDEFFGGDSIKPYTGLYGDGSTQRSADQTSQRNQVLELADQLTVGAGLQGRHLSLDEALTKAHDVVSKDYNVQALRSELREKVQTRAKSISLRPTKRTSDTKSGKETLVDRTRVRLAKVFG